MRVERTACVVRFLFREMRNYVAKRKALSPKTRKKCAKKYGEEKICRASRAGRAQYTRIVRVFV